MKKRKAAPNFFLRQRPHLTGPARTEEGANQVGQVRHFRLWSAGLLRQPWVGLHKPPFFLQFPWEAAYVVKWAEMRGAAGMSLPLAPWCGLVRLYCARKEQCNAGHREARAGRGPMGRHAVVAALQGGDGEEELEEGRLYQGWNLVWPGAMNNTNLGRKFGTKIVDSGRYIRN
jgi:hypothetical protein